MNKFFIFIFIIVMGFSENCFAINNKENIDNNIIKEEHLKIMLNSFAPQMGDYYGKIINSEIKEFFNRSLYNIKSKKIIWINSFFNKYLSSMLMQNYNNYIIAEDLTIIKNLKYIDNIKLYFYETIDYSRRNKKLLYFSEKKHKLLNFISKNILEDTENLFNSPLTFLSIGEYKRINIILVKKDISQFKNLYDNYLGQSSINFKITNSEYLFLKKSFEDEYLNHYNSYIRSIKRISMYLSYGINNLKGQSIFEKFKKKILYTFITNRKNIANLKNTQSKSEVESQKDNIPNYIFDDNNNDIPLNIKRRLLKLKQIDLIIMIYRYIY